jgi:hypothetical protein
LSNSVKLGLFMSNITLIVPMGALEWAKRMLHVDATFYSTTEMTSTRIRTLKFVQTHAATIEAGPTLFHVGGNVQRATSVSAVLGPRTASFAVMDTRFCLLGLLDANAASTMIQKYFRGWKTRNALNARVEAAIVIQKHFKGWKTRMEITFNPLTTLGAYYALREFRVIILDSRVREAK